MSGEESNKPIDPDNIEAHKELLKERLPLYGERARDIEPGAHGSVEWLDYIGTFLWQARESQNVGRRDLADRMGIEFNILLALETGLTDEAEIRELGPLYGESLGLPKLYEELNEKYHIPD